MPKQKRIPGQAFEDVNTENEFDNIDDGDHQKGPSADEIAVMDDAAKADEGYLAETKEGDTKEPIKRNRRKPGTSDEVRQLARTLPYESRRDVIKSIMVDMEDDIQKELEEEQKKLDEQQARADRLKALKGGQ